MKNLHKLTTILCAVSILLMITAPTAFAAEEPRWVEKAPMPTATYLHNSAVANGKIYVTGGNTGGSENLNTLHIYNPVTDTWTTGEPMPITVAGHVSEAVDGKIYVIKRLTHIYDPETNTWTTGTPIPQEIIQASSVEIDGKIYVIGGSKNRMDIYNPATDTWTTGTPMPAIRRMHVSEAIDGKIYVIGGYNQEELNTMDIYNPATDTWTTGEPMPEGIYRAASVSVDGKIYVMGGDSGIPVINSVYIYDPVSNSWSVGSPMTHNRSYFSAELVNNTVYAIGGIENDGSIHGVEALELSPQPVARKLAVLLNGGETAQLSVSNDLTDNASMTWTSSDEAVATVDTNGRVTAVAEGLCEISVQNADGLFQESIPVRVFPGTADLYRLAVHLNSVQNARLYLTEDPADTTWKSLDTAVVTVDATGEVSAVSQGLVIVEATADGETYQIYVRVKE